MITLRNVLNALRHLIGRHLGLVYRPDIAD